MAEKEKEPEVEEPKAGKWRKLTAVITVTAEERDYLLEEFKDKESALRDIESAIRKLWLDPILEPRRAADQSRRREAEVVTIVSLRREADERERALEEKTE